jgi:hypothetical protein
MEILERAVRHYLKMVKNNFCSVKGYLKKKICKNKEKCVKNKKRVKILLIALKK